MIQIYCEKKNISKEILRILIRKKPVNAIYQSTNRRKLETGTSG
jgi:hypothetical protein